MTMKRLDKNENADRDAAEGRWGDAIDWLLNSRYMDPEALVAFWGVVDGHWSVEDADRGFIDGRSLTEIANEADSSTARVEED